MTPAQEKLQTLRLQLRDRFLEREDVIDGLLAAMLAGEHVLLLGTVGTGKSMLASELCERLSGARYFQWLLTRFTTPEELFGPVSLKALEEDRYLRVMKDKLPEAHVTFLDEIFKANSAILNSLLTLMNERVFHNGEAPVKVPLITMVAASNELPDEGELMALYDRFMVRFSVDYIKEDFRFLKLLTMEDTPQGDQVTISLDELETLRVQVQEVELHESWLGDLVVLRRKLNEQGVLVSDRRWRKSTRLMKAWALVDGRDAVNHDDMMQLVHVLWNDPGQAHEIRVTLQGVIQGDEKEAHALLDQAREVRDYALRSWGDGEQRMRASIEAHTKIKRLQAAIEAMIEKAQRRKRSDRRLCMVQDELGKLQQQLLAEGM